MNDLDSRADHDVVRTAVEQLLMACPDVRHWDGVRLEPLRQEEALRQYFRATPDQSGRAPGTAVQEPCPASAVVMWMPAGSGSDEQRQTSLPHDSRMSFVDIGKFLERVGLAVPHIFGWDRPHGLILVSDLGDDMVSRVVMRLSEMERGRLFRRAVQLLVRFQQVGYLPDRECVAFQRRLDARLLGWELETFVDRCAHIGQVALGVGEREMLTDLLSRMVECLEEGPMELVHRDFSTDNIMLADDALWLVDFQDATIGPLTYDLATLLCDAHSSGSEEWVDALVALFVEERKRARLPTPELHEVMALFRVQAIQRALRELGRASAPTSDDGGGVVCRHRCLVEQVERHAAFLPEYRPLGAFARRVFLSQDSGVGR